MSKSITKVGSMGSFVITKQWGDITDEGRRILRLLFLLYYIFSLSVSLCFLEKFQPYATPLPGQTIMNYFIVDLFFWVDGFFVVKNYKRSKLKYQRVSISPIEAQCKDSEGSVDSHMDTDVTVETTRYRHRVDFAMECFLQIIMVFPFELIAFAAGNIHYRVFQLSRLVRVLYFFKYWTSFGELLEQHELVKSHAWRRVLLVGLFMAISVHVGACLFYKVSLTDLRNGKDDTWLSSYNTVVRDVNTDELVFVEKVGSRYIISLYWAIQTLDTVGFGDITPLTLRETWFCTLFFYLSAALMYTSLAILVLLISNMDSARARNLIKVARFNKYAAQTKLPSELVRRVKSFYDYQWKILEGVDEHQILSELPSNLSQQVSQQIVRDRLTTAVFLFRGLRKGVLNALCESLESLIYSPMDVVVARRSRVLGVYVISDGEMIMVRTTPVDNAGASSNPAAAAARSLAVNGAAPAAAATTAAAAGGPPASSSSKSAGKGTSEKDSEGSAAAVAKRQKRAAPRMSVLGVESILAESQLSRDYVSPPSGGRLSDPSKMSSRSRGGSGNGSTGATAALIRRSFTGGVMGQERIIRANQAYGISALNKSFNAQHELTARSFVEVFYVSGTVFRHTCRMHMNREEINALFKVNTVTGKLDELITDEDGAGGAPRLSGTGKDRRLQQANATSQPLRKGGGRMSILSSFMGLAAAATTTADKGDDDTSDPSLSPTRPRAASGESALSNEDDGGGGGGDSSPTPNPPGNNKSGDSRGDQQAKADAASANSEAPILRRRANLSFLGYLRAQLEPDSTARMAWKALLLCVLVFYTVSVPLLIAGTVRIEEFTGSYFELLLVSYACDFLFLVDLVLRCAVFSFKHDGVLYTEASHVMQYFLANEPLTVEFLAHFPIDLLLGLFVSWELLPITRLLKMLHLRWFQLYLTSVEDLIGHLGGISLSFEFVRFVTLYCCLFLLCHWVACFWLLGADISVEHFGAESNWKFWDQNTFTTYHPLTETDDINVALFNNNLWDGVIPYVRALYFAGSAMSLGLGDVVPKNNVERIFACVIMFFGYVLFNTILGGIASLIGGFNREKREFTNEAEKMQNLLKFTNLPGDLTSKVMLYYDYLWSRYGGVNEMEVLASLPKSLRSSVVNQRLGPLIANIPFFRSISESMQQMLVSLLQRRVFLDKDCIIQCGETGKELFLIEKGMVVVTSADKKVVYTTLSDGDYMGESCLLEVSKRMSSAFAQGYVDTFYLTTNDFLKAAEIYPDEYDEVLVAIEKILDEKKRKNIVVAVAAEGKRSRACSETIPPQVTLELAKRATMVVASNNNNNNNNNGSTGGAVVAVQGDSGAMPPLSLPEGALGEEGGNGMQVQVSPDKGLAHNQRLAEKRGAKGVQFLRDGDEQDEQDFKSGRSLGQQGDDFNEDAAAGVTVADIARAKAEREHRDSGASGASAVSSKDPDATSSNREEAASLDWVSGRVATTISAAQVDISEASLDGGVSATTSNSAGTLSRANSTQKPQQQGGGVGAVLRLEDVDDDDLPTDRGKAVKHSPKSGTGGAGGGAGSDFDDKAVEELEGNAQRGALPTSTIVSFEIDTKPARSSEPPHAALDTPKFDAQRRPSYSRVPNSKEIARIQGGGAAAAGKDLAGSDASDENISSPWRALKRSTLGVLTRKLYLSAKLWSESFFTQHPEGYFKMVVDVLMSLVVIYYLLFIPLRITVNVSPYWLAVDYVCDIVNMIDCGLNWTFFSVYSQGYLVTDPAHIRKLYYRQRALVDVIVTLPWDLLALTLIGQYDEETILFALAVLRLPKILKVINMQPYYKQLERFANMLGVSFVIVRLLELTVALVVISHWVGCIFYMMAEYRNGESTSCETDDLLFDYIGAVIPCKYIDTWVMNQITAQKLPSDGGSQWGRLVRAFNWASASLSLLTMGDLLVTNPGEALYLFLIEVVGLAINGTIIGYILTLVADSSEEVTHVYRRIEQLRQYLQERHVPKHLIDASIARLQHLATEEGSLSMQQDAMYATLPHSFKVKIENHLKVTPFLRRCPFFDFCTEEVLRGIGGRLRLRIYTRGDKIVTFGELGRNMFFLDKGTVDVVNGAGNVLYATLEDGAFFGETALFFKVPRTATVLAASSLCVCFVLSKEDLESELRLCSYEEDEVLESFRYLHVTNNRRNAAVLKNLHIAETDKTSKLYKMIQPRSLASRYQTSRLLKLRQTLCPESWMRAAWEGTGFFLLLYYIFTIPYWIAFLFGDNLEKYLYFGLPVDLAVDAFWILDIVLKATVFSFHPDPLSDKLITDGEEIWHRYLKVGYFYRDVVSSLPLELLFFAIPGRPLETLLFARTIHFLRVLYSFLPQADLVEFHLRSKLGLSVMRSFSQLIKAVMLYIFLNHWMACVFFTIHRFSERTSKITYLVADGLATYDPEIGKHDICNVLVSECYARSFYFVITSQATIGYGDVSPFTDKEVLWQIVVGMIGAFITATCIGFLGIYFQDVDSSGLAAFEKNKASIERYLEYRQVTPQLRSSILAHYAHLWNTEKFISGGERTSFLLAAGSKQRAGGTLDEGRGIGSTARNTQDYGSRNPRRNNMVPEGHILDLLSEPSVREISMILQEEVINKVPVLRDSNEHIRSRMAVALRPQIGLVGCPVYNAGDTGNSIFFVLSGKVKVTLSADRSVLDSFGMESLPISLHKQVKHGAGAAGLEYGAGCHFGEFCAASKSGLRAESAQVLERAHLYALNKDYLWEVLLYTMPKIRRRFLHQLMCNLGSERLVESDLFYSAEHDGYAGYSFAQDDMRVRYLFRMAYRIMRDLGQDLAAQQQEKRRQRRRQQLGARGGCKRTGKSKDKGRGKVEGGNGSMSGKSLGSGSGSAKDWQSAKSTLPGVVAELEDLEEGDEEEDDRESTDKVQPVEAELADELKQGKQRAEEEDGYDDGDRDDDEDDEDYDDDDDDDDDEDDQELDPQDVHYDVRVLLREESQRRRREGGEGKMLMSLQEQLYHFEDFDNLTTTTRSVGADTASGLRGSLHRFSPRFSPSFRSANNIALQNRLMKQKMMLTRQSSGHSDFNDADALDTPNTSGRFMTLAEENGGRSGKGKGNITTSSSAVDSALDQLLFTTPTSRMSERGRQVFFNIGDEESPPIRRASSLENLPKSGGSSKGSASSQTAGRNSMLGSGGSHRPMRRASSLENVSPAAR